MRRGWIGTARWAVLVAVSALLAGCASYRSWEAGCADVYSGVRYSRERSAEIPFDGKLFFLLDLPGTVILDTLVLPVTAFSEPGRPVSGFPSGCRWASPR